MKKPLVACGSFERVAKGVAEIQDVPQARFVFVLRYHLRFDANATCDHARQRRRVASQ